MRLTDKLMKMKLRLQLLKLRSQHLKLPLVRTIILRKAALNKKMRKTKKSHLSLRR